MFFKTTASSLAPRYLGGRSLLPWLNFVGGSCERLSFFIPSTNRSSMASVWLQLRLMRRSDSPSGTVGGRNLATRSRHNLPGDSHLALPHRRSPHHRRPHGMLRYILGGNQQSAEKRWPPQCRSCRRGGLRVEGGLAEGQSGRVTQRLWCVVSRWRLI